MVTLNKLYLDVESGEEEQETRKRTRDRGLKWREQTQASYLLSLNTEETANWDFPVEGIMGQNLLLYW